MNNFGIDHKCIKFLQKYVYAKNGLLPTLPDNSSSVQRMMKSLEGRLIKNGLLSQFNASSPREFINTGVIAPVSLFPGMSKHQVSYIPLCYTLANNAAATTKLRICTNSSFKSNTKAVSLNECMISGPEYLNSLDSILTRWRTAARSAHSEKN